MSTRENIRLIARSPFKHFLFVFSNEMLVFRVWIHKMLVRIAKREDPDQTATSEAV